MSATLETRSLTRALQELLVVQLFLGYVFLISGLLVNFLQFLSSCLIWPFNRALYRKINYHLATIIWSQMTFVYQWWSNSDILVYIQPSDLEHMRRENSLWLGNHRYEVDWLLGWVVTQRLGLAGGSKILGKQSLRALPIIGWCWHFTESIFLRRVWTTDKAVLERDIRQLMDDYPRNYHFTVGLPLLGTRYTNEKRLESMRVAKEKGLPPLKHHILPRTKGFVLLIKGVHQHISAVYDVTVAFQSPRDPQLANLLLGQPCRAEAFVRRIPIDQVPVDDEEQSSLFIHRLFQEKDRIFEYFSEHGTFAGAGNPPAKDLTRKKQDLIIEVLCLLVIGLPSIYLFVKFLLFASLLTQGFFLLLAMAGIIGVRLMMQTAVRPKTSHDE